MSAALIVRTLLAASPAVTGHVGDRIHYSAAPQGEPLPLVILAQTGRADGRHLGGADRFPEATVDIVIKAPRYDQAQAIGDAAIAALQDAAGTVAGHEVWCRMEPVDSFDFIEAEKAHRRILGARVRFRAA